ncbi:MAG: zinc-binding dehydrogenase [Pseudomonadota bacterium]
MKAALLEHAGEALTLRDLSIGELAATDVVVRIVATSLCHTDLEATTGQLGARLPLVPGHEAAGVVEWIGADVRRVSVGNSVVVSWNPHCGACFYCGRAQPILCEQYRGNAAAGLHFDGRPRLFHQGRPVHQLMYAGTFAELAVVTEQCAVPISRDVPLTLACLLGCGVATGVGAVLNIAKLEAGSSATVIGCGAVGLSAIQGARIAGAAIVIAIDRDPAKLAMARQMGATHTLNADAQCIEAHAALTSGRGADYVFEAAGNEAAFRTSVEIVRPGGQVVWLGKVPVQQDVRFRWGSLMGEKRIVRSSYGGGDSAQTFAWLADAYLRGELMLEPYVTSRIQLEDINSAMDRLRQGLEIRAVIEF